MNTNNFVEIISALHQKKVIAYPTEAVFGLGCDPDSFSAVKKLLILKKRNKEKGFILVASNFFQLKKYINYNLISKNILKKIFLTWPGFITWLMPPKNTISPWLIGENSMLAVRVSAFFPIIKICNMFGKPLISTSANLSGKIPAKTSNEVYKQFGENIKILDYPIGLYQNPSEIRNIFNNRVIRKG
ncbi:putative ribosome maturation factor [Wigglesworthia glossinidia endosymbiont of Glossina morsitans morsitans (Yale colony)]|uniref:Threonylcarbamoyl-AMP synthase n=1 Tax=Wigglesworthia glossinidia endosymbiont of Glossina morsitans morsitans (Yale colony) TaxID=1142511 RepID=H6Q4P2_WIGGL|nr:Sua5/YciO/YrdC/YwlC family protein [Wigglesworthia glossinidia]AFA41102.1 putative ribosome maturation factor [Wigglesworthia glossinidia endosymbiont of Glossina morsitans morsitans (Yale colony)]